MNALPQGPGPSHRHGPPTSRAAALFNLPRVSSQRWRCLQAFFAVGLRGYTFDELIVDLNMYSAQKRLVDLKYGDWIVGTGRTRPTRTGAAAEVYVASVKALNAYRGD